MLRSSDKPLEASHEASKNHVIVLYNNFSSNMLVYMQLLINIPYNSKLSDNISGEHPCSRRFLGASQRDSENRHKKLFQVLFIQVLLFTLQQSLISDRYYSLRISCCDITADALASLKQGIRWPLCSEHLEQENPIAVDITFH